MRNHIMLLLFICWLPVSLPGQTVEIQQIRDLIEKNNRDLQAYQYLMESAYFENRASNNLPDPEASFYFLSDRSPSIVNYSEYELTQQFEFPTVYGLRRKLTQTLRQQTALDYQNLRQQILLEAEKYCIELNYWNRRKLLEDQRTDQARMVKEQTEELFARDQVGVLELNKSKIAWLNKRFAKDRITMEIDLVLASLQRLNGGEPISADRVLMEPNQELPYMDSLWQGKMDRDPALILLKNREEVSLQDVQLKKSKVWPRITAGYNYQGVPGERFGGVYGGLSIPLWGNRGKVRSARAWHQYRQRQREAETEKHFTAYRSLYHRYQLMRQQYLEYQSTLSGLNNESLLLQAYNLGEISFMTYLEELQFYNQAYDTMLELEKGMQMILAELLKHEL